MVAASHGCTFGNGRCALARRGKYHPYIVDADFCLLVFVFLPPLFAQSAEKVENIVYHSNGLVNASIVRSPIRMNW